MGSEGAGRSRDRRQAREEAILKQPLQPGRYLFSEPQPSGAIDGLRFTLTEVDIASGVMLLHIDAKDVASVFHRRMRLAMILQDGTVTPYKELRLKQGDLRIVGDEFNFFFGMRGAFVMEFPAPADKPASAFSIAANDRPLFAVNLRNATCRSF